MEREIFVTTMRAHGERCIGCVKHNKKLMISFQTEKHGKVRDIFLDEKMALSFQKELNQEMLEKDSLPNRS